ncbi:MAG: methylase [Thaumarchaeota archaeon]|nr:methylase [Nitrososphaerota archaeon]
MALLGRRLAVAFPDTLLEEKSSLRDKTVKLGIVARACAIYGVDVIEVFRDQKGHGELAIIRKVLEFLETPQYLRRRLFPLDEALKYAGILPPLRIPSHKPMVPVRGLKLGETREGVTNADGTVDIGLEERARLAGSAKPNIRLTVKVESKSPLTVVPVARESVQDYWGYVVETKSVEEVFSERRFDLNLATSRLGDPISDRLSELRASFGKSAGVKLVFGSPSRGLFDIVGPDLVKKSDFVLNLFAEQHVETVRTEEAIFAGLGLVNTLMSEKA